MAYSIYFVNESNLYLEVGFEDKRLARKKLEEIANCFTNGNASGEIHYRNDNIERNAVYEITYKDCRAVLHYRSNKKIFKNSK
jgi:hypothetical protein